MKIDSTKLKKLLRGHKHFTSDEKDIITQSVNLGLETAIKVVELLEHFTKEKKC